MKKSLDGLNSILDMAKDEISDLNVTTEIMQNEAQRIKTGEERKKINLSDLWNVIKHSNICLIEVLAKGG